MNMNNKYRINVMDIILISLIACIVIVFGYTSLAGKSTVDFSQKQKFNILVFTDDILIKNADLFKVGDEITLAILKKCSVPLNLFVLKIQTTRL